MTIRLPAPDGRSHPYTPRAEPVRVAPPGRLTSRTVFAAAHVVANPYASPYPSPYPSLGPPPQPPSGLPSGSSPGPHLGAAPATVSAIDWDTTLAFRRHLWSYGLGVAEAMDTAQRGMGLEWPAAAELIRRSAAEARAVGGRIACGVGTDQLTGPADLATVRRAYEEQLATVEEAGAQPILMASRALVTAARGPEDYLALYGELLRQSSRPVILHWLGPMFDPALDGYWGSTDLSTATTTFLQIVTDTADKVDGVKISLLDAGREIDLRRRLPAGVRCFTGDDFHYPELIAGDERGFSHALLGVFDPLGPLAADAVRALDAGDTDGFRARLDPTVELARHLFQPPTRHYKTGVVLLAWLAGHQSHFTMVGGHQSARSLPHLATAYELADRIGLFPDPALAESRMRSLLTVYGVDA
ncbi:dihydrodipicolinate synthase family protein [Streptomyces sp. NPDC020965]|uniref:dihydrodipicolinate synthase family protein n=1 Tax=Streptomyces sp. NPDC020965 TaxID=3365105 RepID=UPI0037AEFF92